MRLNSPIARRRTRIEIIPLIDIMFFLLASFMKVSLSLDNTRNLKVPLPFATQAAREFPPGMLNITVDKSGGVWLERKQVALAELEKVLRDRFHQDPYLPVYLSGDRDTLHGAMADVLTTVRSAGFQQVGFLVGDEPPATTAR